MTHRFVLHVPGQCLISFSANSLVQVHHYHSSWNLVRRVTHWLSLSRFLLRIGATVLTVLAQTTSTVVLMYSNTVATGAPESGVEATVLRTVECSPVLLVECALDELRSPE